MKRDSLVYKYKKAVKQNNNSNNDELKKIRYNYVTKLFFRIFLSTLILLGIIIGDRITLNNYRKKLSEYTINNNWNFLNLVDSINALFGEFIVIKDDIPVEEINYYDNIEYVNGVNYVTNSSNGVNIIQSGVITKIKKDKNNTYEVSIQTKDNYIYTYLGLTSIDYSIYNYVEQGNILGLATRKNSEYQFSIKIKKGDTYYDYYNIPEN